MKVEKKDLGKSQLELVVTLDKKEMEPYVKMSAEKISKDIKIDGFRPGKAPIDVIKQKVGDMAVLEEAARIAINKTLDKVVKENIEGHPVGQPQIDITKLAPDNEVEYKVTIALLPEVKLGDYKDLKIKQDETVIDEKEIDNTLEHLKEMRVKEAVVDREAKENDKVLIDIEMFLDKVPVEGGQGKGTTIIIGKDYIVPGFDKQIAGMKKGEERTFELMYPADAHMKNLAGKKVNFKVKLQDVYERELPELNEDFAKGFQFNNIEELKDNIRKSIKGQKEKELALASEKKMLEAIMNNTKFGDIPEMLINHEAKAMMAELEQGVVQQGGKFEDYLASIKKSKEELLLDMMPEAVKRVKISLIVREVAQIENINVKKENIEKHINEIKEHYKDDKETLKRIEEQSYKDYVANVMTSRKVVDKLRGWNIVKA